MSTFPTIPIFTIYCSTGCSCCNNENHHRGPFSSRVIAEARVTKYREMRILASQYSKNGNYSIGEHIGEVLPDGRIISGDHVYEKIMDDMTPGSDEEICEYN